MHNILCYVVLDLDIEIHPEVIVDLLETSSLDEERQNENSILLHDSVHLSKIGLLVLIIEECLDIDNHIDAQSRDVAAKLLGITPKELHGGVGVLGPVSLAILNVALREINTDGLMRSNHLGKEVQSPSPGASGFKKNSVSHVVFIKLRSLNHGILKELIAESIKVIPEGTCKAILKVS